MRIPCLVLLLLPAAASAEVHVFFREGAPRDRIVIENAGACPLGALSFTLDFTTSLGGVHFDMPRNARGPEDALRVIRGAEFVEEMPQPPRGATDLSFSLSSLPAEEGVSFNFDVDDRMEVGAGALYTIRGPEIEGAAISAGGATARFDAAGEAVLPLSACLS